jgi:hypothetical protein
VAPPKSGKTTPPIPHISVTGEVAEPETLPLPKPVKPPLWKNKVVQIGAIAAVLVLGAGGYLAYSKLFAPPPPPPPKPKAPAPTAANPAGAAPAKPTPAAPAPDSAQKPAAPAGGQKLSDTQAAIAHAPVNAINKAQAAVDARKASGQSRDGVAAITSGEPSAEKPAALQPAAAPIAPGLAATTGEVEAAPEASPAFRAFVANAKITGVFQGAGNTARVMFNSRIARVGDVLDPGLGVTFEGYDSDKKLLAFKDKNGATVTRRYP